MRKKESSGLEERGFTPEPVIKGEGENIPNSF